MLYWYFSMTVQHPKAYSLSLIVFPFTICAEARKHFPETSNSFLNSFVISLRMSLLLSSADHQNHTQLSQWKKGNFWTEGSPPRNV